MNFCTYYSTCTWPIPLQFPQLTTEPIPRPYALVFFLSPSALSSAFLFPADLGFSLAVSFFPADLGFSSSFLEVDLGFPADLGLSSDFALASSFLVVDLGLPADLGLSSAFFKAGLADFDLSSLFLAVDVDFGLSSSFLVLVLVRVDDRGFFSSSFSSSSSSSSSSFTSSSLVSFSFLLLDLGSGAPFLGSFLDPDSFS